MINKLAEVRVGEGESIEAALRRFKREVLKAGIILEVKKRKHYESPRQRRKRKAEEAKRKAVFNANRPPRSGNGSGGNGGNSRGDNPRDNQGGGGYGGGNQGGGGYRGGDNQGYGGGGYHNNNR